MTVRDLTILGCSSQQPTRRRNHGAYLFRWNDEGLLFDPGEGTQRQFIYANVAPTCVTRIFVSHFHGDHCLGLGSMLMRLNLDKVTHPIHCYYPASEKKYFDRLRYGTIYRENINVVEHPVEEEGIVCKDDKFTIEAYYLDHGVTNLGWRIKEHDQRKFDKKKLVTLGIKGPLMQKLLSEGVIEINGEKILIDQVSYFRPGTIVAVVIDTKSCPNAFKLAENASLLLCESTYLESEKELARKYLHLTAKQAAEIAKQSGAKQLILTHYSARYANLEPFVEQARAIFPATEAADDFKIFPIPR